MWRKLKMGGKGKGRASKEICCCERKVVIEEFSFFLLPNKSEGAQLSRINVFTFYRQLYIMFT
jgi:hypothetical protein